MSTSSAKPAVSGPVSATKRDLPAWPFLGYYWTFPAGWALGLGPFLLPLWSAFMAAHIGLRRGLRVPAASVLWAAFLMTVLASGLMIDTVGRGAGWAMRVGTYVGATVAMVYVFNSRSSILSDRRVAAALVAFWVWIVLGGWLGVLFPNGSLSTPVGMIMPSALMSNELVRDLVNPNFAEVQEPWGSPVAFARPSAPLPYTNGWGTNYALLTVFTIAMWAKLRGRKRGLLTLAILLSLVPAALTLNRGMVLGLSIALVYVAVRFALRGRLALLLSVGIGVSFLVLLAELSGLRELLELRTTYSTSALGRSLIYQETFERTLDSPLLGWGGPRPSYVLGISVGTQGHLWNVMFSYGFLGLGFFLGFLWWSAWRTRHCSGFAFAAHVVLVVASVTVAFYGFDGPQMMTALVAAGLGYRQLAEPPSSASKDVVPLTGGDGAR